MFWQSDRLKSTFSIPCKTDGLYDFIDKRENWPTCVLDINCTDLPPEIPTSPEYVLKKDDGRVLVERYVYPLPTGTIKETLTSEVNSSLIPRNFNVQLK